MRLIDADALMRCIPAEEIASRMAVANAPTVEERKTGKWIDVACPNCGCKIHIEPEHKPAHWIVYEVANTEEEQPIAWQCPNCDEVVECKYNFCPECGQELR